METEHSFETDDFEDEPETENGPQSFFSIFGEVLIGIAQRAAAEALEYMADTLRRESEAEGD
jgi:hypothetical protein